MKRCLGPAFLLLARGPRPAASPVPATQAGPTSLADQCLAEAAAPRQPRSDAPEKITLSHVLVRHKDSKRPEGATRSRGEACLRAREAREKLLGGGRTSRRRWQRTPTGETRRPASWAPCPIDLDPTFADAAFALGVGSSATWSRPPAGST